MEWDPERVKRTVFESIGGSYINQDAATHVLEINLVEYTGPDGAVSRPCKRAINSYDTAVRARLAPGISELEAILGIFDTLKEIGNE